MIKCALPAPSPNLDSKRLTCVCCASIETETTEMFSILHLCQSNFAYQPLMLQLISQLPFFKPKLYIFSDYYSYNRVYLISKI
jgi:hypothetical protein